MKSSLVLALPKSWIIGRKPQLAYDYNNVELFSSSNGN
jgi:hypothetical protein